MSDKTIGVANWLYSGELESKDVHEIADVEDQCFMLMESACSYAICGSPLFLGTDGVWYTVITEAVVKPANPEWVRARLHEAIETTEEEEEKDDVECHKITLCSLAKLRQWLNDLPGTGIK